MRKGDCIDIELQKH